MVNFRDRLRATSETTYISEDRCILITVRARSLVIMNAIKIGKSDLSKESVVNNEDCNVKVAKVT